MERGLIFYFNVQTQRRTIYCGAIKMSVSTTIDEKSQTVRRAQEAWKTRVQESS